MALSWAAYAAVISTLVLAGIVAFLSRQARVKKDAKLEAAFNRARSSRVVGTMAKPYAK
jgi:hypothetical protein